MNELQKFIANLGFGKFLEHGPACRADPHGASLPGPRALWRLPIHGRRQDVPVLMSYVIKAGDYVRDVSLPVGSDAYARDWRPEPTITPRPAPAGMAPRKPTTQKLGLTFNGEMTFSDADPGL